MDIEKLSKSQIILLTLLVSFVTSIATGIVTVSLMEQAPPTIAQSVNRIVERTVERIVPGAQSAATVITKEKTVVVRESELISQAVERSSPAIVRLYASNSDTPVFLGLGVVLDSYGAIGSDTASLGERGDAVIELQDGERVRAFVTSRSEDSNVAFLQSATSTVDGKVPVFKPAAIGVGDARLGQTVITLIGKSRIRIADGIITALVPQTASGAPPVQIIETNISEDAIIPGSVLVNTDGEVIAINTLTSRGIYVGGFVSASALTRQPAPVEKEPTQ